MLLEHLSRNSLLHQPIQVPADDGGTTSIVGKFSDYLRQQRGLASGTIKNHRTYVAMFLGYRFPDGTVDLSKIEAKDLVTFMQKEAARRTPMSARHMSSILRSFTTYLFSAGMIDRDLSGSVPTVRCWSLSGIPKALTRKQVTRVLAGCNRKTATGRRDFAVLLLLVRPKFGKSRLVPIHPTTVRKLRGYWKRRETWLRLGNKSSSHFFMTRNGTPLSHNAIYVAFRWLSVDIGLRKVTSGSGPRIHDLRHRFAVKTLINWYRSGKNAEVLLPALATFLGHVSVESTYWYLTEYPELMKLAMQRLNDRWEEKQS
jgi:site-specific recombinase XerD